MAMTHRTGRLALASILGIMIVGCGSGSGGTTGDSGSGQNTHPLVLASQPFNQVVVHGSTALLKASVHQCEGTRWQWQKDGANLSGASGSGCLDAGATLYIKDVTASDAGTYSAIFTNSSGSLSTSGAVLDVVPTRPLVADTGVKKTQCYGAGSNALIACDSSRAYTLYPMQDGMRNEGFGFSLVHQYSIQDCVHDDVSGLTWEGKVYPPDNAGSTSRGVMARTYEESAAYAAYINGIALCGYTDWRIPTYQEFLTIWDFGYNEYVFAWLRGNKHYPFWTSTLLDGGPMPSSGTSDQRNVRLARGIASNAVYGRRSYNVSNDQTEVTDQATGLTWKRCAEGRVWNGTSCFGAAFTSTHEEALAYARGAGEWRLPNIQELLSIAPTMDNPESASLLPLIQDTGNRGGGYWSSSPCAPSWGSNPDNDASFSAHLLVASDGRALGFACGPFNRNTLRLEVRLVK